MQQNMDTKPSGDFANDLAELTARGMKGDDEAKKVVSEIFQKAQSEGDARTMQMFKDAGSRIREGRFVAAGDRPTAEVAAGLNELRGKSALGDPNSASEPTDREQKLLRTIKTLMRELNAEKAKNGDGGDPGMEADRTRGLAPAAARPQGPAPTGEDPGMEADITRGME